MLVDEAEIVLKAGHGGAGKVSFYPGYKAGPDGGNGGRGGDLYIKVTSDLTSLKQFTYKKTIQAADGQMGQSNRKFGKDGGDKELLLPVGSLIINEPLPAASLRLRGRSDSRSSGVSHKVGRVLVSLHPRSKLRGITFNNKETGEQLELEKVGQRILFCKGGKGGKGNFEFKSPKNTTPMYAQSGLPGEVKEIKVNLRLIADFGLIGLPNAGKSSLLNELTHANAKTASYPFTTLEPNLGVFNGKILADIPGLIEGASHGKGLGIKFLKHIEKVSMLLHCIAADSPDLLKDYETVRSELKNFSPELLGKKEIILLTKSDLVDSAELKKKVKLFKKKQVLPVSIHDWDHLEELKKKLNEPLLYPLNFSSQGG